MENDSPSQGLPPGLARAAWQEWWPLAFGISVLVLPSWIRFAFGIWQNAEYSHAPIVIAMALYLFWRERAAIITAGAGSPITATVLIAIGAILYVPAVWIQSGFLESATQIAMIAGALALMGGAPLVRKLALPILLLLLAAPLPGNVIAAATGTLKEWVSVVAEAILYQTGYPIARGGVTLTIGSYRMLVADACSGMNSLFSLSAVGLFYLSIVSRPHRWQTAILALAIVPIAIATNIVRVVVLLLITYYLGDDAGQGFLHEFSGLLMFLIAVSALIGFEGVLRLIDRRTPVKSALKAQTRA